MANNSTTGEGSYIVRDKRGAYMGAYSEKLGSTNAKIWATDCARQSKGTLYYRGSQESEEQEVQSFTDLGKKQ